MPSTDLTTLFSAHIAVLRAAGQTDATTAVSKDIVTVRSTQTTPADLNTQEFVYLQSHS